MNAKESAVIVAAIYAARSNGSLDYSVPELTELDDALTDWYASLECPADAPLAVRRAIALRFLPDIGLAERILRTLHYSPSDGYYSFSYAGMFFGVEPDGYIHT